MRRQRGDRVRLSCPPVPGCRCRIRGLGRDAALAERLSRMGILPGMALEVTRVAPLGGTVELAVDPGQRLALRSGELAALDCEPLVLPLSHARLFGDRPLRVRGFAGGRALRIRMGARGLQPGTVLRLLDGASSAPRMVLAGGDPLTLGRGEARRVLVEPADAH